MNARSMRVVVLAMFAVTSLAPIARAGRLSFSLQGGLSVASVAGQSDVFDPLSKRGFSGQMALQVPLVSRLSIAPEFGYAMRGFSYGKSQATDYVGNISHTFETLLATEVVTLALPVSLAVPIGGGIQAHLLTGPEFESEASERLVTLPPRIDRRIDLLRNHGFDWLAGAGFDIPAGPGRVGLGARYVHGLTQLAQPGFFETHTRAFEVVTSFTVGL